MYHIYLIYTPTYHVQNFLQLVVRKLGWLMRLWRLDSLALVCSRPS